MVQFLHTMWRLCNQATSDHLVLWIVHISLELTSHWGGKGMALALPAVPKKLLKGQNCSLWCPYWLVILFDWYYPSQDRLHIFF